MRAILLTSVAVALSACCGPNECNRPEGAACAGDYQCGSNLDCTDGICRTNCNVNAPACGAGTACWADPSGATRAVCLPAAAADEQWTLRFTKATNTNGGPNELGDPDTFICAVVGATTLCTEEQTGTSVTFNRTFAHVFTTSELQNVSITVFDSDAVSDFAGCEGSCTELSGWPKDVIHGQAVDGRPPFSRKQQVWTVLGPAPLMVELVVDPVR